MEQPGRIKYQRTTADIRKAAVLFYGIGNCADVVVYMRAADTENISEELVVFHCSPTMAGLKTGSLFNCPAKNDRAFVKRIREMNGHLNPRGARIVPLKNMGKSMLVYMYRPDRLREDLSNSVAKQILAERDYPVGETEKCIVKLVRRLEDGEVFPHEIGLFLGYTPEDVDGFIKNGATGAKCIGAWKVYGNVEAAQRKFAQYRKCTQLYCEAFQKHHSFDRLIVGCS